LNQPAVLLTSKKDPRKNSPTKLPLPYLTGRQTRAFRRLRDNTNPQVARENADSRNDERTAFSTMGMPPST
jgi:hypothetical protein